MCTVGVKYKLKEGEEVTSRTLKTVLLQIEAFTGFVLHPDSSEGMFMHQRVMTELYLQQRTKSGCVSMFPRPSAADLLNSP